MALTSSEFQKLELSVATLGRVGALQLRLHERIHSAPKPVDQMFAESVSGLTRRALKVAESTSKRIRSYVDKLQS